MGRSTLVSLGLLVSLCVPVWAQQPAKTSSSATTTAKSKAAKPEFPPYSQVLQGYEKVVSTAEGKSFYTIWVRKKDNQMLAELPKGYEKQRHFIAMTISSGDRYAGLQAGDLYVYWRRYDKRLALIEPNVEVRSTGDPESQSSVKRLFTDRVILEVPIVTIGPNGMPVIDMDELLVGQASKFFGRNVKPMSKSLVRITEAKAFPQNVELAFEMPMASPLGSRSSLSGRLRGGTLQTLHYSISLIPQNTGYKPRLADQRVGYFTTSYSDYGKYSDDETRVRYINRWHLEKRDPHLKVSPPVKPIVFYIEHTTPVRYRRWVRQGILYWNKAFERIGIANAIEVYYQDAKTGAYMDLDPEDVRYNFVRWLNNDVGTAIGPSRVNPETGEILDADIILTDGWIRHFRKQYEKIMPRLAMEGFGPETVAWLAKHPDWDPRIRLAHPAERAFLTQQILQSATQPFPGLFLKDFNAHLIGRTPWDGLIGRTSQINGLCLASEGLALDVAMMRALETLRQTAEDAQNEASGQEDQKKNDKSQKEDEVLLDGMPESFIGPLLAELVAHEVGHTLGLRHNYKGSAVYTLSEINSDQLRGKKPLAGSVMDYLPVNFRVRAGEIQGDYTMIGLGPYDYWAIEYGYSFEKDLKPILQRVAEPELQFATDEDTTGPDPLARRYDFSKNPLDYANEQMHLVRHLRSHLLDRFVKDGQSWAKAREGYELSLSIQLRAISMMANWIGGAFVHRDKKGDKNGRPPIQVVPAKMQRDALKFVIDNTFNDQAYQLSPKLLQYMTVDKWLDGDSFVSALLSEATWPIHDRIMGIQASVLTMLMNPTTLRRVYDNEFRVPPDQDALTLAELLDTLSSNIWQEIRQQPKQKHSARKPLISSLRRNLQQEHLRRLITLSRPGENATEAYKPIANLALLQLRQIRSDIERLMDKSRDKIDPYTLAHLTHVQDQIEKTLSAVEIYNTRDLVRPSVPYIILGQPVQQP